MGICGVGLLTVWKVCTNVCVIGDWFLVAFIKSMCF